MALVQEFMLGNTKVKIYDDYCKDKTPEDVKKILDRIAEKALRAINADLTKNNSENISIG